VTLKGQDWEQVGLQTCLLSPGGKLTKLLAFGLPAFLRQAASFWYFHSEPPANGRGFTHLPVAGVRATDTGSLAPRERPSEAFPATLQYVRWLRQLTWDVGKRGQRGWGWKRGQERP